MILESIQKQINDAMKARDKIRLSTLKMLSSELHNQKIKLQHELSDKEEIAVVRKEVKKRKDAIETLRQAKGKLDNVAERVQNETKELEILQEFLPDEMSDEELEKIVNKAIEKSGVKSIGELGKVMGSIMGELQGKVDGNRVSSMVKEKLSS